MSPGLNDGAKIGDKKSPAKDFLDGAKVG